MATVLKHPDHKKIDLIKEVSQLDTQDIVAGRKEGSGMDTQLIVFGHGMATTFKLSDGCRYPVVLGKVLVQTRFDMGGRLTDFKNKA